MAEWHKNASSASFADSLSLSFSLSSQLCKELEVGIRIVQEGGEEPDIPSYVHVDELEDIRQSLESLLPPDEE